MVLCEPTVVVADARPRCFTIACDPAISFVVVFFAFNVLVASGVNVLIKELRRHYKRIHKLVFLVLCQK